MAVREGFATADPYTGSLLDRVRMTSAETFLRRFVLWTAAVVCGFVLGRVLLGVGQAQPGPTLTTAIRIFGATASVGAAFYCFGRFVLGRELHFLWAATAFTALAAGSFFQTIADSRAPQSSVHGIITSLSWFVASLFFLSCSFSQAVWRVATRREACGLMIGGLLLVSAFPISILPYSLDPDLIYMLNCSYGGALACYIADVAARCLAPALVTIALVGFYRKFSRTSDRQSGAMCYFLVTCLVGLVAVAASREAYDGWWLLGHYLLTAGWVVLVVGFELENAFAHREANERLHELETLHHVSWSMVGAGTSRELMQSFAGTLVEGLGARIAAVYLVDESEKNLELAALHGLGEGGPSIGTKYAVFTDDRRPGFHTGHTARAFSTHEVQIASDVFVDVEFVPWKMVAVNEGCAASLPLVNRGRAIGVLNLYFSNARQFTRQRLKLFATIAAAAAPAIENVLAREQASGEPDADDQLPVAA